LINNYTKHYLGAASEINAHGADGEIGRPEQCLSGCQGQQLGLGSKRVSGNKTLNSFEKLISKSRLNKISVEANSFCAEAKFFIDLVG
jgi:hypothetical protein